MPSFGDCLGVLPLVKMSIRVKRHWFVSWNSDKKGLWGKKSSDGIELVGCSGVLAPARIFRGRQKLEKGANGCITNDARTPWHQQSNFQVCQKMLTIALLAVVCILIACFPTAALILKNKYIWVRIWIANCDLRKMGCLCH